MDKQLSQRRRTMVASFGRRPASERFQRKLKKGDIVNKKLFKELADSVAQMRKIVRGKQAPSRAFQVDAIAVKRVKVKRGRTSVPTTATKVGRALRRATKDARRTTRMYGVPIYVWENGKVVAIKP